MENNDKKIYQIEASAHIKKMKLNINLPCKVSVNWVKGIQYGQTSDVDLEKGIANINQSISIISHVILLQSQKKFQEKKIRLQFNLKNPKGNRTAGILSFNVSNILNQKKYEFEQEFRLEKCPDQKATVYVKFDIKILKEVNLDQLSNASNFSTNSEIILENTESKIQLKKSNFGNANFNKKDQSVLKQIHVLQKKIQCLQEDNQNLKKQNTNLQKKINEKQTKLAEMTMSMLKIEKLEKKLKKCQQDKHIVQQRLQQTENLVENLKEKIEQNNNTIKKKSIQIKHNKNNQFQHFNFSQQNDIEFNQCHNQNQFNEGSKSSNQIEELKNQIIILENQLCIMSQRVGDIFNVAQQIGGSKLLQKIQTSIGLIQSKKN